MNKKFFTVPNLISLFRIILIPFIIWQYCVKQNNTAAVVLIVISGISDVADGRIARKFNLVSDIGKIIDPIADKLTQGAIFICLASKYKLMYAVILLFAIRELCLAVCGIITIRSKNEVNSAKWYGKVSTAYIYPAMGILVLFDKIPRFAAEIMLVGACLVIVFSFILYLRFYLKLIKEELISIKRSRVARNIFKVILICLWGLMIAFCFINREKITPDKIVGVISITPHSLSLAIILMLIMFALKSLTVVVYCGFLYTASGMMFPLPIALAVNILGTAIMLSIPYFIGRAMGGEVISKLTERYKKLQQFREIGIENEFFLAFIVRIIGILPGDPMSSYMGAIGMEYKKYIAGSVLGMLPSIVAFPIIGMSIKNPFSPTFIAAAVFEVCVTVASVIIYTVLIKRKQNLTDSKNEAH